MCKCHCGTIIDTIERGGCPPFLAQCMQASCDAIGKGTILRPTLSMMLLDMARVAQQQWLQIQQEHYFVSFGVVGTRRDRSDLECHCHVLSMSRDDVAPTVTR